MLYHTFSTQEEIDQEYNPRFIVENTDELIKSYFTESQRVLREYSNRSAVAYGPTLSETLDIFPAEKLCSPIHIFFHGGYWHSLTSRDFAFVAEGLVRNGITAVLVNYALCPSVSIDEIVRQSRAAAAWTYRNAEDFGGNPEQITVSGHSAGGHLTGMLLSTDWEKNYGLPPNLIKGFLPVSGLFDLKPFPFSWLQPKLLLSSEQVLRNSPVFLKPVYSPHVMVAVGADESHEFQRQSKNYTIFLQKHGVPAEYLSMPGKNHFNIIHDFLGDGGLLCKKIIEWK
ncbi:MAG: alpha/beta hydrolase [Deltaproteobacteria bacterium]|jgi:arylformamidase|nr:alpha/beta hydrolase [Deltaproteobacteria bacterium]MBT4015704.1 alpha/beta hydrolase [Deltaproteobacteria bacterium]MBT5086805.1 alpha/beta hydrolase [Deltaproteobacteria bacterium]MBT5486902.1 alpha/beta hydrolase [Deltaproteobacteria bacterium]MBT5835042.1 alpha/beta hydrolase [Deltaproteobacteria bacterium]